jgi:hypothetical protein
LAAWGDALDAGVSGAIAMQMCGHETRSVFDRYNIVTGDDLEKAVAKLDRVVMQPTDRAIADQ